MATQSDYGEVLDDTIRSFVSKEETLTDVDIQGINVQRPRELMVNLNSFALLFQENQEHDNKNSGGRVFDYRLGGQNSRFNRLQKKKRVTISGGQKEGRTRKENTKKGDKKDDSDDSNDDKDNKKIPHFKTNVDGSTDTLPQALMSSFSDMNSVWGTPKQIQV